MVEKYIHYTLISQISHAPQLKTYWVPSNLILGECILENHSSLISCSWKSCATYLGNELHQIIVYLKPNIKWGKLMEEGSKNNYFSKIK